VKITKKSLVSLSLLTIFAFLTGAAVVSAAVTAPTDLTGFSERSVTEIIQNITNWIVGIVSLVAVLVIVIAGVMWATAGGNEDQQGKARKLLISGVIGLLIALAALAIVKVVIGRLQ